MNVIKQSIWVEKWRPTVLSDMVLPEKLEKKLSNGVNNHMLFYGGPGMGKTTLAKILAADTDYKYINCSVDTGIDTVRNTITEFCSNIALSTNNGERKQKIVILDEFDGVSDAYMKAMRGTIEQFASTTKFIATCNFISKIPDYMQSRFDCIDFNVSKEDETDMIKKYIKRIYTISKSEGLTIDIKVIAHIVKNYFPDLRSTITWLQSKANEGVSVITLEELSKFSGENKEFYEILCTKPFDSVYEYMYKNFLNKEDNAINSLGRDFINYILKEKSNLLPLIGPINSIQAEWSYKINFVADKFTVLSACSYNIHKLVNGK